MRIKVYGIEEWDKVDNKVFLQDDTLFCTRKLAREECRKRNNKIHAIKYDIGDTALIWSCWRVTVYTLVIE